jgi:hypothetical protein
MLRLIKLIHTFVWGVMALATLYILYAGITNTFDTLLIISLALLSLETLVLIFNKWTCPLTPLAGNFTTERKDNFDIYLPLWLATYNKHIFGTLFVAGLALICLRLILNV